MVKSKKVLKKNKNPRGLNNGQVIDISLKLDKIGREITDLINVLNNLKNDLKKMNEDIVRDIVRDI